MKLIVGLGNPGSEYASTRHNIGFMVVDRLANELSNGLVRWDRDDKKNVLTTRIGDVLLVKPQTFMNKSGYAVKTLIDYVKATPQDLWVIHDDIDLPLGKIRIRRGGGSAGHNGVSSIIEQVKTDDFLRFRMGIGRGKESTGRQMDKKLHHRWVIAFVLSHFRQREAGELRKLIKYGAQAVEIALTNGVDRAMNRFN
ncbi:aminoacyl-tRNA hydrolase [Candidatus Gottesmanbacteria bacterium]|nr:aminoacyl-tRNA hydrolase [Candidatus Gottesmanbacteria bacterium]